MGLLDGGVQRLGARITRGFRPRGWLLSSELEKAPNGNLQKIEPDPRPIRVQIDACTEAQRNQAGYTDKDVRLLVSQVDENGAAFEIKAADVVEVCLAGGDQTFTVATVGRDPAGVDWECRATPKRGA